MVDKHQKALRAIPLGPVDSGDVLLTPLNQGRLVTPLGRRIELGALRYEHDGYAALRDVRIVLVTAIWPLKGRVGVSNGDNGCLRLAS